MKNETPEDQSLAIGRRELTPYRQPAYRPPSDRVLDLRPWERERLSGSFPQVAALLSSSLEELRTAEEELIEIRTRLMSEREDFERHLAHLRRLFEQAPCALFVTDLGGGFQDANKGALALLGRAVNDLDGKCLDAYIAPDARAKFNEELNRLSVTMGVADWRFSIERPDDRPAPVSAAVHVVGAGDVSGTVALYWCVRQLPEGFVG